MAELLSSLDHKDLYHASLFFFDTKPKELRSLVLTPKNEPTETRALLALTRCHM